MTKKEKVEVEEAEVIQKEEVSKKEETKQPLKAYFGQRLAAYIIDIVLVTMVTSIVMLVVPVSDNLEKVENELTEITEERLADKITDEEYIQKSMGPSHDIAYYNVSYTIVDLVAVILYFIVFQFYNNGQTLGKKVMKIRIVKTDGGPLTINDLIFRTFIVNALLANMITLGFTLFANDYVYFYVSMIIEFLQLLAIATIAIMVMYRKDGRGLQDFVAHTKVIQE